MRFSTIFVISALLILTLPFTSAQLYGAKGCVYWCEWVGFQCCMPGMGLGNHLDRYDMKGGGAECYAKCGVPPPSLTSPLKALPDFTVTRAEVQGQNGQWSIGALIENQGEGSYVNTKDSNLKLQIRQTIQRYPPRVGDKEKSANSWYRLKSAGAFAAGDKKWTRDMGLRTFLLVPGTKYIYIVQVNPNGGVKETTLGNNVFKAVVVVDKDGALTVEKQ